MIELEILGEPPVSNNRLLGLANLIFQSEDPANCYCVCIKLADSEEMRQINRQYRGCDKSTDILSFVTCEMPLGKDSQYRILKQCDIVIDTNQLALQKGNRSLSEEFLIVLIHGLLHLVGYDHMRKQDANIMENKEIYYQELIKVKE